MVIKFKQRVGGHRSVTPERRLGSVADEARSGSPAGAPLTCPTRGARGPASAAAPGPPRARARGSGLCPNWVPRARAAHGFGGASPRLFVQQHDGPRPCVCPGAGLGPSSVPCPPDGPRFLSRHRSSPGACPRLGPGAARRGGLGPGAGAALGLALSDGSGARESPQYLPWLDSCPRPPGNDPRATTNHKCPRQVARFKDGAAAAHLCARAFALGRSPEGAPAPGRQGAVVVPGREGGSGGGGQVLVEIAVSLRCSRINKGKWPREQGTGCGQISSAFKRCLLRRDIRKPDQSSTYLLS